MCLTRNDTVPLLIITHEPPEKEDLHPATCGLAVVEPRGDDLGVVEHKDIAGAKH
jgi:hypothetical protein